MVEPGGLVVAEPFGGVGFVVLAVNNARTAAEGRLACLTGVHPISR